jgi:hypothetical protein
MILETLMCFTATQSFIEYINMSTKVDIHNKDATTTTKRENSFL